MLVIDNYLFLSVFAMSFAGCLAAFTFLLAVNYIVDRLTENKRKSSRERKLKQ